MANSTHAPGTGFLNIGQGIGSILAGFGGGQGISTIIRGNDNYGYGFAPGMYAPRQSNNTLLIVIVIAVFAFFLLRKK